MTKIDQIRAKSAFSAKVLIAEFAYCAILFFVYNVCFVSSNVVFVFYITLLIALPLALNGYIYLKSKSISDAVASSHAIINQILIIIFSFKFLVNMSL